MPSPGVAITQTSSKLMDLARHSDAKLTLNFYSHTVLNERAEALEGLPLFATKRGTGKSYGNGWGKCLGALIGAFGRICITYGGLFWTEGH